VGEAERSPLQSCLCPSCRA